MSLLHARNEERQSNKEESEVEQQTKHKVLVDDDDVGAVKPRQSIVQQLLPFLLVPRSGTKQLNGEQPLAKNIVNNNYGEIFDCVWRKHTISLFLFLSLASLCSTYTNVLIPLADVHHDSDDADARSPADDCHTGHFTGYSLSSVLPSIVAGLFRTDYRR